MPKIKAKGYGPQRITTIIASGSLCVAIALATLLLIYDIANDTLIRLRFWIACASIVYLAFVVYIAKKGRVYTANWLIILLYESLAATVLIHWGLTSTAGILTACFALLLPGVFMSPRLILPVSFVTLGTIIVAHTLHATRIVTPVPYTSSGASSALDVIALASILGVFALVSWISAHQSALSLSIARSAEDGLRKRKELLAVELEQESSKLRQMQLQQIQQLYRFAVIGQSATAMLHELSNHLSILNLDIDDIKQQHRHSRAIASAEAGIEYINSMVRKARAHLNARPTNRSFNIIPTINRAIKDAQPRLQQRHIKLIKSRPTGSASLITNGDPMSLLQCLSILLNNAIDACTDIPESSVTLAVDLQNDTIVITIADTGPGIEPSLKRKLFHPLESTKPTGAWRGALYSKAPHRNAL